MILNIHNSSDEWLPIRYELWFSGHCSPCRESVMEQQSEILAEPWCVFHAQNENISSFSSSCLFKMLEVEPLGLSYYWAI